MSETFQDRARARLRELDLSPSGASEKAGLNRETLTKLLKKPEAMPNARTLSKLAKVLRVSEQWLLTGTGEPEPGELYLSDHPGYPMDEPEFMAFKTAPSPLRVPVKGTASGSLLNGTFFLEEKIISYVPYPPALKDAKDIYALYVEGTSMEPLYRPGNLVFVNPHKPPRTGDPVIVQFRNHSSEPLKASIGFYFSRTPEHVVIGKLNPASEVSLTRETVKAIHLVLSVNEMFGA